MFDRAPSASPLVLAPHAPVVARRCGPSRAAPRSLRLASLLVAFSWSFACRAPEGAGPGAAAPEGGQASPHASSLPDRDPELARRMVQEGALLLDVRSLEEWDAGHLPGAHHLPVGELEGRLPEVAELTGGDKSRGIVTYCMSGGRAGRAKALLEKAGYRNVTNLGGIEDWPERP